MYGSSEDFLSEHLNGMEVVFVLSLEHLGIGLCLIVFKLCAEYNVAKSISLYGVQILLLHNFHLKISNYGNLRIIISNRKNL